MALEQLTATEARVAGLVATGYTNGEIGRELALGDNALERHLAEVYRKLGVLSRTELALLLNRRAASRPPKRRKG